MRKALSIVATGALFFGLADPSQARILEYDGTLLVAIGTLPPLIGLGTGVATINSSGALDAISVDGGLSASATIPLTDPINATLVTLIGSVGLPTMAENNALSGISGGAPLGPDDQMALGGHFTMCLVLANCVSTIPIPITVNGTVGAGLGGIFTVNTFAHASITENPPFAFKMSVEGAPWTIGVASLLSTTTNMSPAGCEQGSEGCITVTTYFLTETRAGFAHGPNSASSTADAMSGVLQIVAPIQVFTTLDRPSNIIPVWGILSLHTTPEPGFAMLLGSGVVGLVLLGRQRMQK